MAVDSNALTLSEYGVLSNDPLVRRVTYSLLNAGSVFQDIPLMSRRSMLANGVRWIDNLPTVNWARLNEEPTVTKGKPTPYQEQAYLIRNAIDVDRKLVEDENQITDPRAAQIEAYLQGVAYDLNFKFVNNDHLSGDAQSFVGLRYRIDNPTVYGVNSDMKIDGGAVDMTTAMTATTANTFIELVDQLLQFMGNRNGDGVILYMNDTLIRRFARAVRTLGAGAGWDTTMDAYGRVVERYRGAIVRDVGRKADQTTRVITATETSAGADGSDHHTSLYAVRYGEGYTRGWQYEPLAPMDLGLLNNGVIYRVVFDWAVGLWIEHTRAIGRIFGIKVS